MVILQDLWYRATGHYRKSLDHGRRGLPQAPTRVLFTAGSYLEPPNAPLLRALWSLLVGIWGI